ncbi:M23 family metallopeptidase [soil metagenome]
MKMFVQGVLFLAAALACLVLAWFALTRGVQLPTPEPAPVPVPSAETPQAGPVEQRDAPAPAAPVFAPGPAQRPVPGPTGLIVPVAGTTAAQLQDTFEDARGSERRHEAIDIMAPEGTPVLAVADGHVEKLFDSERGGLTIYQFEPSGRYSYYYSHLQRYAPGLAEGQALRQGQVIGYVGSTGNADAAAPHLHFAIFLLGPGREWWRGTPVNPYPLLGGH